MSVRTMAKVWELSKHGGSELLMLLAIADFADDEGRAYPAVGTLATKARMSSRNVNHILAALRASGELEVKPNEGPHGTNRYRIRLDGAAPLKPASALKSTSAPEAGFTPEAPFTLKPASDEPSLNHQEPSVSSAAPTRLPACPVQQIVSLYHEALPELVQVRVMDAKRKKAIGSLWTFALTSKRDDGTRRAASVDEALSWVRSYFDRARLNDFIMGRTARSPGHENWRPDIEYVCGAGGQRQVLEQTEAAT